MNEFENIRELVFYTKARFKERPAFYIKNKKGYDSISFDKFTTDVLKLASVLIDKGYNGGKHIALIGENSYEWVVSALAVLSSGNVLIPVDKELTEDEILNVVKSGDSTLLFYSAFFDDIANSLNKTLGIDIINTVSLRNLLDECSDCDFVEKVNEITIDNNSMCAIVFTSGTTGISKGVMLSHTNFISNVKSCFALARTGGCRFSVLPMHHTYEFTLGILYTIADGCATAINDSLKYISQNFKLFKPTDLTIVPLIAETLYNSMWANIRTSGKEKTVKRMIKTSNILLKLGIDIRRKVFSKIHDALGGRVGNIFCGGAPIDPKIAQCYIDFGFKFNIGYGITECAPLISGNVDHNRDKMASCGRAISCNEVKILNPDSNGEGEICAKGSNVMLGYYNNPQATERVMQDGWFATGDIGRIDQDGMIYITGRVKNIIVLKNGKNIYPEELELLISRINYVKEVVVYSLGASMGNETALAAEVYPDAEKANNDNISDYKRVIEKEIEIINKELPYYKRITQVNFRDEEFVKTTTKKIKREKINGK